MFSQRTFVLLAAATLSLPASAQAQCDTDNEHMAIVRAQAVVAGVIFASNGYELVNILCGALDEGEHGTYDSSISPNTRIGYVAVCDQDCSDVDLRMYEDGELVAQDVSRDDVPIIRYLAREGGDNYRIDVEMYACSVEPCFYAVAMYRD